MEPKNFPANTYSDTLQQNAFIKDNSSETPQVNAVDPDNNPSLNLKKLLFLP